MLDELRRRHGVPLLGKGKLAATPAVRVCRYVAAGQSCHFGTYCHFSHEMPSGMPSATTSRSHPHHPHPHHPPPPRHHAAGAAAAVNMVASEHVTLAYNTPCVGRAKRWFRYWADALARTTQVDAFDRAAVAATGERGGGGSGGM